MFIWVRTYKEMCHCHTMMNHTTVQGFKDLCCFSGGSQSSYVYQGAKYYQVLKNIFLMIIFPFIFQHNVPDVI